jgi:Ca2+-binding EF-hand superfamily protein
LGRSGDAREKIFTLTKDKKQLKYTSSLFSWKFGAETEIKFDNVVRIQKGQKTYPFERLKKQFETLDSSSLSIIYNSDGKEMSLDLIARTGDFDHIYKALKALLKEASEEKNSKSADELYVKKMFEKADADQSGTLSKKEVIDLIMSMNINMKQDVIKSFYEKVDDDNNGVLSLEEFHVLMDLLRTRPELEYVWSTIIENNYIHTKDFQPFDLLKAEDDSREAKQRTISLETFIQFYNHTQAPDTITAEKAVTMFTAVLTRPYTASEPITYYTWSQFMLSTYNDAFNPDKGVVYEDMTKSLSLYYMASSHNTYLEGDQLTSKSSVNRYIDDLLQGCRCVELDCWDGDKEPIIYHGHTLTSKITFRSVCDAINEVGFKKSPYPIVLSIENHCSLPQQEMLANIMKETFKESLLLPMVSAFNSLPSPDALKHKILVKGKRSHDDDAGADEEEEEEEEEISESTKRDNASKKQSSKSEGKKKEKHDIHPALSEITFLSTGKVKQFNATTNALPADQMCSYSEITTNKYTKKPEVTMGWINHNKKHLSRIYPKGILLLYHLQLLFSNSFFCRYSRRFFQLQSNSSMVGR